ncbi:PQQ-binding-like beta-propeller repeat protein [Enterobacteriaceae endosymbiont of Plateumaris braccata]|uniref:outer membrane protein assembly factor BamB family protein n=1 Tax=Enterobacteriaceae endosymbiont of Plateumaris braccata TaxID=2675793 RepID=UPI0014491849|nr:PQQ-binding-like beta-propeller repeat protein [Enterobacteriaceae endosymbiont of Plateumaris braccata]QJC28013.1 PQQ-binding-like beta-propeller repeat protein [Enterobacteriaceae endosymbiont of Plateumaris braccata]
MKLQKLILIFFIFCSLILTGCSNNNNYCSPDYKNILKYYKNNLKIFKKNQINPRLIWFNKIIKKSDNSFSKLHLAYKHGLIYIANKNGIVKCVNMKNGKIIWNINLAKKNFCIFSYCLSEELSSGPVVSNNYLYLGSEKGKIIALNNKNGNKIWETFVFSEVLSDPVISKNILIVHNDNNILQGLDKNNGHILWTISLGPLEPYSFRGTSKPAVFFDNIITGSDNGIVSSCILNNGFIIWQRDLTKIPNSFNSLNFNDIDAQPIIANGIVYVVSYNGNFNALDLSNGNIIWKKLYKVSGDFIINNNSIYFFDINNNLLSLNIDTGNIIWSQKKFAYKKTITPIYYKNNIIIIDKQGKIYFLNANNGNIISHKFIKKFNDYIQSSLLVHDKLILQTYNGIIYMFKL